MQNKLFKKDIFIFAIGLGSFVTIWLLTIYIQSSLKNFHEEWVINLIISSCGYFNIILPTFLVYHYAHWSKYYESEERRTRLSSVVRQCFLGNQPEDLLTESLAKAQSFKIKSETSLQRILKCSFGILIFLLIQASLQEKIMTIDYVDSNGNFSSFKNSQFLGLI